MCVEGGGRACVLYAVYIILEISRTMELSFVSMLFTDVLEII